MKLTRNQSLILWALLSEGGGALAGKLKPELKKPDRDALTKAGLIGSERRGRANWVSVTDSGWSRIASLELPDLSERSAAGAVLQTLIGRLKAYSHISGVALADILAPRSRPSSHSDQGGTTPFTTAFAGPTSKSPGEGSTSGHF